MKRTATKTLVSLLPEVEWGWIVQFEAEADVYGGGLDAFIFQLEDIRNAMIGEGVVADQIYVGIGYDHNDEQQFKVYGDRPVFEGELSETLLMEQQQLQQTVDYYREQLDKAEAALKEQVEGISND